MSGPDDADAAKDRMRVHTRLAATISRSFAIARAADLDTVVDDALRLVATELDVDVAFVTVFDDEHVTGAWEWTRWAGPGRPVGVGERLDEAYGSILEGLHLGHVIRIADIPALGMAPADAERFAAIDARSTLMVPVRRGERLAGAASLLAVGRYIDWTEEHVAALQFHGDLLVGSVERLRQRTSRDRERRRTAHIAAQVTDALLFTDAQGRVTWASPSAGRVLGYEPADLHGRALADVAVPAASVAVTELLGAAWAGEAPTTTTVLRRADGHERWFDVTAVRTDDPDEPELLVTVRDAHARHLEVAALADLALTDSLTGLLNRRGLRKALAGLGADHVPARVVFIDLDRFKAVNDRHGHAVGDEVLAVVGDRLRRLAGPSGLAARLGGDEFVVVLPGAADDDPPVEALEAALVAPVVTSAGQLSLGASLGVGALRTPDDAAAAIGEADAAMYRVKRARR